MFWSWIYDDRIDLTKLFQKLLQYGVRTCSKVTIAQCRYYGSSLSQIFDKNFVKSMVLLKELLNSWFDDFFFQWERISRFSTLWIAEERTKNLSHSNNSPSNQFTINLFSTINWFHGSFVKSLQCTVRKFATFSPTIFIQKFRQIKYFTKELYCKSIWRKNFRSGENFWNFHTVQCEHMWKLRKFALTQFLQQFRESNAFTRLKLIWREKIWWE